MYIISCYAHNMLLKKMYIILRSTILKKKQPDITNLATSTTQNAKINEVKGKIPSMTIATTAAVTAVETKILDHSKYITTPEFNMSTAEIFAARLAKANLASKSDIVNFVRKTDFDDKLKNYKFKC